MNYLLEQFLGKEVLTKLKVKKDKKCLFSYITNMKWKEFVLLIKYDPLNIISPYRKEFPLLTRKNVDIFFSNIYIDLKSIEITPKKNVNEKYLSFIRGISLNEINNDVHNNNMREQFNEYMNCFFSFN